MSSINDLPEELLERIIRFLDNSPPSVDSIAEVPAIDQLFRVQTSLKRLSELNHSWRRVTFPHLFKHLKTRLQQLLPPAHYCPHVHLCRHEDLPDLNNEFLAFASKHKLATLRPSLVIYQCEECTNISALGHRSRQRMWERIFSAVNPSHLTVIAPPRNLGDLAGRTLDMTDNWAFKIAHQRLDISLPVAPSPTAAHPHHQSSRLFTPPQSSVSSSSSKASISPPYPLPSPSPYHLAPWTHLTYHSGSHLPVFGSYHYFEKRPPCLISSDFPPPGVDPVRSIAHGNDPPYEGNPHLRIPSYPKGGLLPLAGTLTHLSFHAVFPHVAHITQFAVALLHLDRLEELTVQLTPTRKSTLLDDLEVVGKGNLNLKDCWAEAERDYAILAGVCGLAGHVFEALARAANPVHEVLLEEVLLSGADESMAGKRLLPRLKMLRSLDGDMDEVEMEHIFYDISPGWVMVREGASGWSWWRPN